MLHHEEEMKKRDLDNVFAIQAGRHHTSKIKRIIRKHQEMRHKMQHFTLDGQKISLVLGGVGGGEGGCKRL